MSSLELGLGLGVGVRLPGIRFRDRVVKVLGCKVVRALGLGLELELLELGLGL